MPWLSGVCAVYVCVWVFVSKARQLCNGGVNGSAHVWLKKGEREREREEWEHHTKL